MDAVEWMNDRSSIGRGECHDCTIRIELLTVSKVLCLCLQRLGARFVILIVALSFMLNKTFCSGSLLRWFHYNLFNINYLPYSI